MPLVWPTALGARYDFEGGIVGVSEPVYILDDHENLSTWAVNFLRTRSRRVHVDRGLSGDDLGDRIVQVYGQRNEAAVDLLTRLQSRYAGLSYESGFFQSDVIFAPACEPEDPDEELEILCAVETGSPAGASVRLTGEVEVGLDGAGVLEFASLDVLIECDAMFAAAGSLALEWRRYVNVGSIDEVLRLADGLLNLRLVPRASGSHTFWFEGDSSMVFASSCWSELGLGMPPLLRAWADSENELQRISRILAFDGAS